MNTINTALDIAGRMIRGEGHQASQWNMTSNGLLYKCVCHMCSAKFEVNFGAHAFQIITTVDDVNDLCREDA